MQNSNDPFGYHLILPCPTVTGNGQMQPLQLKKSMVLRPLTNEGWVIPPGKPPRSAEMIANGKRNLDWIVEHVNQ